MKQQPRNSLGQQSKSASHSSGDLCPACQGVATQPAPLD